MPACRYCGQETGGSAFCQNCGAKVEEQPAIPSPIPQVMPNSIPTEPIPTMPTQSAPYSIPTMPSFYTPGGAGGLLAGNIIALILGVCTCCFIVPIIAIIVSIIGIVFASKVKNSTNAAEEKSTRTIALVMMLLAFAFVIIGTALFVVGVYQEYGGFEGFFEYISEQVEEQEAKRKIFAAAIKKFF